LPPRILIDAGAFETLLLSAIEVYPSEAIGLLFGTYSGSNFRCRLCYPIQAAARRSRFVYYSPFIVNRLIEAESSILGYPLVGMFHSHPNADARLSNEDRRDFLDGGYRVELVVSVRKNRSERPWVLSNSKLSGTVAGYRFELVGYVRSGRRILKAELYSPAIEVFNALVELRRSINSLESPSDLAFLRAELEETPALRVKGLWISERERRRRQRLILRLLQRFHSLYR